MWFEKGMRIEIGKKFRGDFLPASEGPVLDYTRERLNLVLKLNGLTDDEVRVFETNENFRFGLFLPLDGLFFLVQVPGLLEWADAPYSVATLRPDAWPEPASTSPTSDEGMRLSVVLVEGKGQKVRGLRIFKLGKEFSHRLVAHVEELKKEAPAAAVFLEKVSQIQALYPSDRMVSEAAVVELGLPA